MGIVVFPPRKSWREKRPQQVVASNRFKKHGIKIYPPGPGEFEKVDPM
jgi:hypothetical protein